ncbi:MAG: hypothetical protein IPL32_03585 [Chloracidobacterium sp.]|nr:hypothetical protein [Chloracidobacterium sp.]
MVRKRKAVRPVSEIGAGFQILVCLINGLGDAFLALPVIRSLIQEFGGDNVIVWSPSDIFETVFSGLSCGKISLHFSREHAYPFLDETGDRERALKSLQGSQKTVWISLNAYSPLWPIEISVREVLQPLVAYGFGGRPEFFRNAMSASITPMRDQYFHVIGETVRNDPEQRRPYLKQSALTKSRAYVDAQVSDGFRGIVMFHTDTEATKQWDIKNWLELASLVRKELNLLPMALGRPSEKLLAGNLILSPPSTWDLQVTHLANATCFVGIDSVFAHIADSLGIPGLTLFGQSCQSEWGPKGPFLLALTAPTRELSQLKTGDVFAALCNNELFTNNSHLNRSHFRL